MNNCLHVQSYLHSYLSLVNILQGIYTKKCQLFMMDCTVLCSPVHHLHHHHHRHWEHHYHCRAPRCHFDSREYKSHKEILLIYYCFKVLFIGSPRGISRRHLWGQDLWLIKKKTPRRKCLVCMCARAFESEKGNFCHWQIQHSLGTINLFFNYTC